MSSAGGGPVAAPVPLGLHIYLGASILGPINLSVLLWALLGPLLLVVAVQLPRQFRSASTSTWRLPFGSYLFYFEWVGVKVKTTPKEQKGFENG